MIRHDLVGKTTRVVKAKNESLVGIKGTIVDETKNTLRVRTDRGEKTLMKEQVVIEVDDHVIDGELLVAKPEKRTKLRTTTWQRKTPKKQ